MSSQWISMGKRVIDFNCNKNLKNGDSRPISTKLLTPNQH